ncbi:MAG: FkbM family methyltransferase [Cyclobacteriaceae bacterium]|nr:FkbM family methyltransferase [Cyclobacteriaceae bacterium]
MIKKIIQSCLQKIGYEVKKYPSPELKSRLRAMENFKINKILDVGANAGQFGKSMRSQGFRGEIVSFEPLSSAFGLLKKHSQNDANWTIHNMAIGDTDGEITINVSKNSFSSSIRNMLPTHLENASESVYIEKEKVKIHRLDSIFENFYKESDHILLKIDTQGYEKNVLDGASRSLDKIVGISLEMSLVPLYEGEMLFLQMIPYLQQNGFTLYSLESEFTSPNTGQLLQVNGVFYKNI